MISRKPNINDLSIEEKKTHIKNIYAKKSYFQQLFQQDSIEKELQDFGLLFRNEIERLLFSKNLIDSATSLEYLHEILSEDMKAYNFDDGVNKISTFFYDTDRQFMRIYYQFISFLRQHFLTEPFWFQATPTIRIHCPHGKNNHHYPRYHSDISYGHPPEEINIWFPLTEPLVTHGFRILSCHASEQQIEKFDYDFDAFIQSAINDKVFSCDCDTYSLNVTTPLGKMLAFDSRCIHTGEPLIEHTRVSIDMRILPLSRYENMEIQYQGSGRRKILFEPGYCYHSHHSDDLENS